MTYVASERSTLDLVLHVGTWVISGNLMLSEKRQPEEGYVKYSSTIFKTPKTVVFIICKCYYLRIHISITA